MTEQEWLTSDDPARMLQWVYRGHGAQTPGKDISDRKLRLFACACCRDAHRLTGGCSNQDTLRLCDLSDQYADDIILYSDLKSFQPTHPDCSWPLRYKDNVHTTVMNVINAAVFLSGQAALLRDICGNPWKPVTLPQELLQCDNCSGTGRERYRDGGMVSCEMCDGTGRFSSCCPWLRWNDGAVPKMAQMIYDARTFDQLPIMADALEDAGCDNLDILQHCRGWDRSPYPATEWRWRQDEPHVRGCWVLDLLLGKS